MFILAMPLLLSCGSSGQGGYHGYLYFTKGPYLMRFSLRDSSEAVVTSFGDKTLQEISGFGENRLLIAESSSIARQEIHQISWLDLKTGQSSALYSGVKARYLANTGLVVYDDGRRLYAVAIAGDSGSETIFSHKKGQLSAVLVVSNDNMLFETSDAEDRRIHFYDIVTGAVKTLDRLSEVCKLEYAVWIDDFEQLACREQAGTGEPAPYLLVNLEGEISGSLPLPEGKRFYALTYVPEQAALILSERRDGLFGGAEKSAVWVHNIHSGENLRLAKNQKLGRSVVYTRY